MAAAGIQVFKVREAAGARGFPNRGLRLNEFLLMLQWRMTPLTFSRLNLLGCPHYLVGMYDDYAYQGARKRRC